MTDCLHCRLADAAQEFIDDGHHCCFNTIAYAAMEFVADQIVVAPADMQAELIERVHGFLASKIAHGRAKAATAGIA